MTTQRLIVCLDVKDGRVMKGTQFELLCDVGDPAELAARYEAEGADEVVLLDVSASSEGRGPLLEVVRRAAERLFVPLTVGGGIDSREAFVRALRAGADKVAVNTAALRQPGLITKLADIFGSQCVVVAIDAKRTKDGWRVFSHSATRSADVDAVAWAQKAAELGAGELLVTSIDRDGTRVGYDIELLRAITQRVRIPVIASGGAGTLRHFLEALVEGGCDAALAASLFHYRELTVKQVKDYLTAKGVVVRP